VKVGQSVALKARAYPQADFQGVVTAIAPVARQEDDGQPARTILVLTEFANPSFLLKPEMTGNAKISTGKRRIIDLMTRRFARYIRVEFWSLW
jgi:HlyD family secretion protein